HSGHRPPAFVCAFFFQAEDGIRDFHVTGVQTCALPIWRRRYLDHGLEGLHDEMKPGRPRTISDEQVAMVVRKTLKSKPKGGTHWAVRPMAESVKISKSTVHRIWNAFALQPHRQKSFKLSNDPFFVEKVRDIVGLYLR